MTDSPTAATAPFTKEARQFIMLTLGGALVIAALAHGSSTAAAPLLTMATPTLATLAISWRSKTLRRTWRALGMRRGAPRHWPVALLLPAFVAATSYGIAAVAGVLSYPRVDLGADSVVNGAFNLLAGLVIGTLFALSEEIGWRGFLLPALQTTMPRTKAALVTGFIHGIWHLPLILLTSSYDSVGSKWIVAPIVVLNITLGGIIYAWLQNRSNSVWAVAVAHNAFNTFIEALGRTAVTATPATAAYVAGESGIASTLAIAAVAAAVLRRPTRHAREPQFSATTPLPRSTCPLVGAEETASEQDLFGRADRI